MATTHYKKNINLLQDVFTKKDPGFTQTRMFPVVLVGVLILLIGIGTYLATLYTKKQLELKIATLKTQVTENKQKLELVYNINIREDLAKEIKTKRYVPSKVVVFFNQLVTPEAKITAYQLTSEGDLSLRLQSNTAQDVAKTWFYLASNKKIITKLNLQSFGYNQDINKIQYSLKGTINLDNIYQLYGVKEQ